MSYLFRESEVTSPDKLHHVSHIVQIIGIECFYAHY